MEKRFNILPVLLIVALLFALHAAGIWVMIGGHPFWSRSATLIGTSGGAVLFVVLIALIGRSKRAVTALLACMTLLAIGALVASSMGKADFVASYAENRQAGQIWYFGFIAFIATTLNAAALLVHRVRLGSGGQI